MNITSNFKCKNKNLCKLFSKILLLGFLTISSSCSKSDESITDKSKTDKQEDNKPKVILSEAQKELSKLHTIDDAIPAFQEITEPVNMVYKVSEGQSFAMSFDMDVIVGGVIGNPPTEISMVFDTSINILKVKDNGDIKLSNIIDRVKMIMNGPNGKIIVLDTADKVEANSIAIEPLNMLIALAMDMTISKYGNLVEYDNSKLRKKLRSSGNMQLATQLEQMLDQMVEGLFVPYPERPIKTGEKWDGGQLKTEMPGMGSLAMKPTFIMKGKLPNENTYIIENDTKLTFEKAASSPMSMELSNSVCTGWTSFSKDIGFPVGAGMSMKYEMKMEGIEDPLPTETRMIMTISKKK